MTQLLLDKTSGLLPHLKSELHGFSPDDLNIHFSKVSLSDNENPQDITEIIMSASDNGFDFVRFHLMMWF